MLNLFYILIGGLAALFILTFIICLIFRRRLTLQRPLDPRRDQLSIVQNSSYYKRRLLPIIVLPHRVYAVYAQAFVATL